MKLAVDNSRPAQRYLLDGPESSTPVRDSPGRGLASVSLPRLGAAAAGLVASAALTLSPNVSDQTLRALRETPRFSVRQDDANNGTNLIDYERPDNNRFSSAGFHSAPAASANAAERALAAVEELSSYLSLTDSEVADLAGFARRNLSNWRSGREAYASSSRNLFDVRALVAELSRELGSDRALLWLNAVGSDGRTPLEVMREDGRDGVRSVIRHASDVLFPGLAYGRTRASHFREEDAESDSRMLSHRSRDDVNVARAPKRVRKPAPRS